MSKSEETKFSSSKPKTKFNSSNNANISANLTKLGNVRIIQKHLVYVIGLSGNLASKETLAKPEYFGQYGNITKLIVNKNKAYNPNGPNGPSYSAYITYSSPCEASLAILAIDNIEADDHVLRASFGTTKYCTFFIKNSDCPNKDCLYLHNLADDEDIIYRDDMNSNKNIFYEQQLLAMKLADLFNPEVRKKLCTKKKFTSVFPATEKIFNKDIVIENDPKNSYKGESKYKKRYEYDELYYNDYEYKKDYGNSQNNIEYILVKEKEKYKKVEYKDKRSYAYEVKSNTENITECNEHNENKDLRPSSNEMGDESKSENEKAHNSDPHSAGEMSSKVKDELDSEPEMKKEPLSSGKKLYRRCDRSRFDFATNNDVNSAPEVPEFICDLIYKKISRFTFFKNFLSDSDKLLFEKDLKNNKNNSWAQFIIDC